MKRKDNKKRKNNFMDPAYEGYPYNPMTFTMIPSQSTITINGDLLNQYDQIGIFDGSNLVGVHTGIINGVVQIACNAQDTPSDGGFVAGNPVTFKLYDSKKDVVIEGSNLGVDASVSLFSSQGSGLIYELIGISDNNGCMDPSACNYNSEATFDNESCNYNAILSLYDTYGDGWNGNSLTINGINYTMENGDFISFNLC